MSSTYVDGTTPLDAAHMNALQQKVEKGQANGYASLDGTTKVPAGQLPVNVASGIPGLDASSNLALGTAQRIVWAGDTNLYRSAAQVLQANGAFAASLGCFGNYGLATQSGLVAVGGNAGISFGSAQDTSLYRISAGVLQTDGRVNVAQDVTILASGAFVARAGSAAYPVFLARSSAESQDRIQIDNSGRVIWGSGSAATDTVLYRNGANILAQHNGVSWGTMQAAAFSVQSDREMKTEIEEVHPYWHETLLSAGIYRYERDDSGEKHIGLMADELPVEVVTTATLDGDKGAENQMVDLYKLTTALLATVQHLAERLATVEARLA
jgi:hypothetical protein